MKRHYVRKTVVLLFGLSLAVTVFFPQLTLAAEKEILIGGSLPLTGVFAEDAKWVKRGYEYWADTVNAQGGLLGRKVVLKIYDNQSDAAKGVSFLEKVITADKADLIFGGYPGSTVRAEMAVAEKYKMVYSCQGGHLKSFQQGYTFSFGSPPLLGQWWYLAFYDFLKSLPAEQRPKRMAVFTMNNPIGEALMGSVYDIERDLGVKILVDEKFNMPLLDAIPLITKAKQKDCDLLIMNGFFTEGVATVRASKALGYNPKAMLQCVGPDIPQWPEELGADGDNNMVGAVLHYNVKYPGNDRLNEYCKKTYNLPGYPTYFGTAYSWMQTLQQGVEGAKSLDQVKIRDWIRTNGVNTIAGPIKFDSRGLPTKPTSILLQMINQKVELVWPPDQATAKPVYPKPPVK